VYQDVEVFIPRARDLALSFEVTSHAHSSDSISQHELAHGSHLIHGLHAVISVVSFLRDLWTLTEVPALCYIEIMDVSNRHVACGIALGFAGRVAGKDDQETSCTSADGDSYRSPRAFMTHEVAEVQRHLHTCFHVVSGAL
jgi:hypothetical protein